MSQAKEPSLSLADQVAIELREDIIGGRLLPGMPLVESELVNAYNASRNTVREALHHLGREGLTSYVRNKGVIVRRLGIEEVRDIFKVRRTLELQAIAASKPLREYQSDRMLEAIEAAQLAQDRENWQAFGTHSLRFHQHIVGLLRSPLLDSRPVLSPTAGLDSPPTSSPGAAARTTVASVVTAAFTCRKHSIWV